MSARTCPACGSTVPPAANFCPQCGRSFAGADSTAVIPAPPGHARVRASAAGDRIRGLLDMARAQAGARRRLVRLRAERSRLLADRRARLTELGGAVYAGDEAATSSARSELDRLDAAIRGREEAMQQAAALADERVAKARLESQPTQVGVTEPMPPPDEADPPEPARVPEPYPPPGEADPPEPVRAPEPYPAPDEGDPPELRS